MVLLTCNQSERTLLCTSNYLESVPVRGRRCRDQLNVKVDKEGRTPLHYSALYGTNGSSLVDLLLISHGGCEVDRVDSTGHTALMYACQRGHYAVVTTLLRRGANAGLVDCDGRLALHHCFTGTAPSLNCCKLLLHRGSVGAMDVVNLADTTGVTPLMLACQTCSCTNIAIIRYLIEHDADPIAQDNTGRDSFDYCPFDAEYVKAVLRERTGKFLFGFGKYL